MRATDNASLSPETIKVCSLPVMVKPSFYWPNLTVELHATTDGEPFYCFCEVGVVAVVGPIVTKNDWEAVNAWKADPENDSLRARGDARWQAACSFTQREVFNPRTPPVASVAPVPAPVAGPTGAARKRHICEICGLFVVDDGPIPF